MNQIILKPSMKQLFVDGFRCLLLWAVSTICIGLPDKFFMLCGLAVSLGCFAYLLGRLYYLNTIIWSISETQIKFARGIFLRTTDYMELYRIIDYREQQNFIQQIFGIKEVVITSGDKSHPILIIFGIQENVRIVEFLSTHVEQCKEKKKIYEITNR